MYASHRVPLSSSKVHLVDIVIVLLRGLYQHLFIDWSVQESAGNVCCEHCELLDGRYCQQKSIAIEDGVAAKV
eukprot:242342-Amphidinium_carterae.1